MGLTEDGQIVSIEREALKTEASKRTVFLPDPLVEYLYKYKEERELRAVIGGSKYCRDYYMDYVCVNKTGDKWNPTYLTNSFARFLRHNNFPKIRFHDLRHSCATMLLRLGFSIKDVQKQLGHSSFVTTANIYSHVEEKILVEIAEKTGDALRLPKFS